jgi:hypothetical protein
MTLHCKLVLVEAFSQSSEKRRVNLLQKERSAQEKTLKLRLSHLHLSTP